MAYESRRRLGGSERGLRDSFARGDIFAVSPLSKANTPFVRVGQAAGSTAMARSFLLPDSLSRRNGNAMPAKMLPPTQQAMKISGY